MYSCSQDGEILQPNSSIAIEGPKNFSTELPQPTDNRATVKGIALGKKLFFDPILSGNNTIACAACHHADKAFSDGLAFSNKGISGIPMLRNAPALFNIAWAKGYFADGGAKNLESQVFAPLQHEDEMKQNLSELITELRLSAKYPILFKEAFGVDSINTTLLVHAIAQFERSLISANSKYDKYVRLEGEILTLQELKGLEIFKSKCESCHKADFFTDFDFHNNGLDSSFNDNSHENIHKGRYRITGNIVDVGKFKTPSLRNLSFTAPYMHDGRFANIDEVLTHYNSGIKYSATLDEKIPKPGFQLSIVEIEDLKIFLKTLDDYDFTSQSLN